MGQVTCSYATGREYVNSQYSADPMIKKCWESWYDKLGIHENKYSKYLKYYVKLNYLRNEGESTKNWKEYKRLEYKN